MYVLQLLRFLGHDIACPIGYLIDCSAVEELSKRNSEPPGAISSVGFTTSVRKGDRAIAASRATKSAAR